MADPDSPRFSKGLKLYITAVCSAGLAVIALSVGDVAHLQPIHQFQWLSLVFLTILSGLLPVKLPTVNVSISISETFVIAGTLLFGPSGGTVLVLLDALFISLRLYISGALRWQQVLFNLAAPPVSVWVAATAAGITPLAETSQPFDSRTMFLLAAFTTIYFLLNSWLITFALALQRGLKPVTIWRGHFVDLLINYGAAASIASLLIYNTRQLDFGVVAAVGPLLLMLYLTYKWSNRRIEVEREKVADLNRVFLSTIEALALAIDAKDQVTHGHIRRVQRYTMALANAIGVSDEKQLDALKAAALLHDTGKLAVPEYILNKPGPLTPAEFERMKVHAAVGADILKSIDFPYPVEPIVRHHHENWDGTGYPNGLNGQQIPIGARILSVVDCYDALTSDRPYRPRFSRQHAEQVLRERRGTWYDPWVVDTFLTILDELEREDQAERKLDDTAEAAARSTQLDVIAATTAEEREFSELRRDLPLATSVSAAAEILFRHIRRVIPAASTALFVPDLNKGELVVAASSGVGAGAIDGLSIQIGERISGWAIAHRQVVLNSNAALELGPVARTFSTPLRYALAVPVLNGPNASPVGVITVYGSEPFDSDHKRMVESAATLFASTLAPAAGKEVRREDRDDDPAPEPRVH